MLPSTGLLQLLGTALLLAACTQAATLRQPPAGFLERPGISIQPGTFYATFHGSPGTQQMLDTVELFRREMQQQGLQWQERYAFTDYIGAISFTTNPQNVEAVLKLKVVKDVFPMIHQSQPRRITTDVKNPQLKYSHSITGVQEVHSKRNLTGKGVRVGVIDSGIDYKHPALGGCFGKGCRVVTGHDFVGDNYTGQNEPKPDADPREECGGHGTHVAGIIGARDVDFVGVAPDVEFGAYRVFGCKGSTANDIILMAMVRAANEGMNVINMSLGGGSSWSEYPDSALADALAKRGIVVVAALGNDGDKGMWQASSPGLTSTGFGVASFDNMRYSAYGLKVSGTDALFDYSSSNDKPIILGETGIVHGFNEAAKDARGCAPFPEKAFAGKVALIERGSCTFVEKVLNAQNAGAVATLVYNNAFGMIKPGVEDEKVTIPVAGMSQDNGHKLVQLLTEKPDTLVTFETKQSVYDNPSGGKVSSFSSWGPGPELDVKPDIGAPGGLIYSTYPIAMGSYTTLSGTSMATPYMAGSVALYIQDRLAKKMKVSPSDVRDTFKITAKPALQVQSTLVASVSRQGAGLVQVDAALTADTRVSPAHIALNSTDVSGTQISKIIKVTNTGKRTLQYILRHQPAASVNPFEGSTGVISKTPAMSDEYSTVSFAQSTVEVRAGETVNVLVNVVPPRDLLRSERWLYSGFIVLEPKQTVRDMVDRVKLHEPIISIPYSGMKGNYKTLDVLGDTTSENAEFPRVLDLTTQQPISDKTVFSLHKIHVPVVQLHLVHPVRLLQIRLVDATSNKELGVIAGGDRAYLGRNDDSAENNSLLLPFIGAYHPLKNGVTDDDKVLEVGQTGSFYLKVMALRPFGDPTSDASFQAWKSPVFKVDRSQIPAEPLVEQTDSKPESNIDSVASRDILKDLYKLPGTSARADDDDHQRAADKSVLPLAASSFITTSKQ